MQEAVIVDAIRTPIGRAMRGSLKTVRADELAAIPIRALMERNRQVDFSQTVDVLMGSASGIGEQGYNVGRNAALLAGLDHHVPGCTVNRFCGWRSTRSSAARATSTSPPGWRPCHAPAWAPR